MALIDVDVSERHDIVSLPDMTEAEVRIAAVPEIKESLKTGGKFLQLRLEVVDEPYTKDIYHVIMFPAPGDTDKQVNVRKNALAAFYAAFGVDLSEPDTETMVGLTTKCILAEEDDPEFGMRNRVRRWQE